MEKKPSLLIVVSGAESTGKTTLGRQLAALEGGAFVPEHARAYVERLARPYTYGDVVNILRKQARQFQACRASSGQIFFFDTGLVISKIWLEWVYGMSPIDMGALLGRCRPDFTLLLAPDLPWEADPVRENGGESRLRLHQAYLDEFRRMGWPHALVEGSDAARVRSARLLLRAAGLPLPPLDESQRP